MITKKGHNDAIMLSLFKKEATYDAGVTMDSTTACSMKGFDAETDWDDKVETDKDANTGSEFSTDIEIVEQGVKIDYKEARARPNTVAGMAALVMGSTVSTKDGSYTGYKHKNTPVAYGTALKSIQVEHKKGGVQHAYKGVKGNSLKLGGEAGGFLSVESGLIGSGTRAISATAFANNISESWMKIGNCKFWMEDGSDITIAAALTQGAEDISSATPVDLGARFKSFEWEYLNNLEKQMGAGSGLVGADLDSARRAVSLKFSLLFNGTTEIDHFVAMNPLAVEFDLKGALIDASGAFFFGMQLIVPRFKLLKAPLPKGGVDDILTQEFECEVLDNGTDPISILEVYDAVAAYLAA